VTFTHDDPEMIARVVKGYATGLMTEFFPCPEELRNTVAGSHSDPDEQAALTAQVEANLEKHGYANWYDWQTDNWGTKWDISGSDNGDAAVSDDGKSVQFSFDSAWSPPITFYHKMVGELGFGVDAFYYEPGMSFCGRFADGVDDYYEITGNSTWVDENIPEEINTAFGIASSMCDWEDEDEEGVMQDEE
jgi:hypothetical protein